MASARPLARPAESDGGSSETERISRTEGTNQALLGLGSARAGPWPDEVGLGSRLGVSAVRSRPCSGASGPRRDRRMVSLTHCWEGDLLDQAALYGLLELVERLGLELIEDRRLSPT